MVFVFFGGFCPFVWAFLWAQLKGTKDAAADVYVTSRPCSNRHWAARRAAARGARRARIVVLVAAVAVLLVAVAALSVRRARAASHMGVVRPLQDQQARAARR